MIGKHRSQPKGGYGSRRDILLFLLPGMGAYAFVMLYPNLASIGFSLTKWHGYGSPEFIGLDNFYRLIMEDPAFSTAILMVLRSLFMALFVMLPVAFILAFLLSRKVRGRKVFRFFYFLPMVVPAAVLGVMWKHMFTFNGVINFALGALGLDFLAIPWLSTLGIVQWVVLVPDFWFGVCFYIIIFAAGLEGIPQRLYDAAAIDGANTWHELIHITLPSMRAVYVTGMILALPGALSTFIYPYALTKGGPIRNTYTLALWVFNNIYATPGASKPPDIGYGSAIALLHAFLGIAIGMVIWRFGRRNVVVG